MATKQPRRPVRANTATEATSALRSLRHGVEDLVRALLPEERAAAGKALRDKIAREQHKLWKEPKDRMSPLKRLHQGDRDRMQDLVPIRYGRMLESPFAYYRGSAGVMAADLARTPATGIHVQACGDCHLLNFGGFATPERNVVFDVNDFDETLPAPWEWDVKRLAASIMLAARSMGLSDHAGRDCAVKCVRSYREQLRRFFEMSPLQLWYQRIDIKDIIEAAPREDRKRLRRRIDKATKGEGSELDYPKLTGAGSGQIRIREQPPLIFRPDLSRTPDFKAALDRTLRAYRKTLPEDRRTLLDRYRIIDAAIKVVGIGSVGRRCWVALLMSEGNDPLFLQFKEAARSVLEPVAGQSAYRHHGQRVVMGQRLMQPVSDIFLGWVTAANGRHFYVRQLRDAKVKPLIENFSAGTLDAYASACGWAIARSHAKASDISTIAGYLGSGDAFDEAIGDFAVAYADQTEKDHAALKAAVRKGEIPVYLD